MTDDVKDERRELIAERHADGPAPTTGYWLSRNRHEGELSSRIDVWLERPTRFACLDGDVHWYVMGPSEDGTREPVEREHYARWTLARADREVGAGIPDTDRECIAVGMVRL